MPEMLKPTSLIMGAGLGQDVALITDGTFFWRGHMVLLLVILHMRGQVGGVIALVENGDQITIDAVKK